MRGKDKKPASAAEEYQRLCKETDRAARQPGSHLAWLHEMREARFWRASGRTPPPDPQAPKKFDTASVPPPDPDAPPPPVTPMPSYGALAQETDRVAADPAAARSHLGWLHFMRERVLRGFWGAQKPPSTDSRD